MIRPAVLSILLKTPQSVATLIEESTPEQDTHQRGENELSIVPVLTHLVAFEKRIVIPHINSLLNGDLSVKSVLPLCVAVMDTIPLHDTGEAVRTFNNLRQETLKLLEALDNVF